MSSDSTFALNKLPPDILLHVLKQLDPNDICRCLRVNKSINGFIENYRNELPKAKIAIVMQRMCKNGFKVMVLRQTLAWRHEFYEEEAAPEQNTDFPLEHFKNVHNWLTTQEWQEQEAIQYETKSLKNCIEGFVNVAFSKVIPHRLELLGLEPEELDQVVQQAKANKIQVGTLVLRIDKALSPKITELLQTIKPIEFHLVVYRNSYLQREELIKIIQQDKVIDEVSIRSLFGGPTIIMDDVILGWKGTVFAIEHDPTLKITKGGLRKIIAQWTTGLRKTLVMAVTVEGEFRDLNKLLSPFTLKAGQDDSQKYVLRASDGAELHVVAHPKFHALLIGFNAIEIVDRTAEQGDIIMTDELRELVRQRQQEIAAEGGENPANPENAIENGGEAVVQEQPSGSTQQQQRRPKKNKEDVKKEEKGCGDCVIL